MMHSPRGIKRCVYNDISTVGTVMEAWLDGTLVNSHGCVARSDFSTKINILN